MCVKVPSLAGWDLSSTEGGHLMRSLLDIKRAALDNFMKHADSVRQRRVDRREEARRASVVVDGEPSDVTLETIRRQRDDAVAVEVAEMIAEQALAALSIPSTPVQALPSTPSASVRHTRQAPRRRPLRERNASDCNRRDGGAGITPNSSAALLFTPTSTRGRVRTLTTKGKENYRQV